MIDTAGTIDTGTNIAWYHSDGGGLLLREVEKRTNIVGQFASSVSGDRDPERMVATVPFEDKIGFEHAEVVGYAVIRIVVPAGVVRHPVLPRQRQPRSDQLRQRLCRRCLHHPITRVCHEVTGEVFYFGVRHGLAQKLKASGRERRSGAGATRADRQIQQLYKNPILHRGDHSSSPSRWASSSRRSPRQPREEGRRRNCHHRSCPHLTKAASGPLVL